MDTVRSGLAAVAIVLAAGTGWAARQGGTTPVDGAHVYDRWCATCHADHMPGTIALQTKYAGEKPPRIEQWRDLESDVTHYVVRNGIGPMPRFRKTEITDAELDALADYLAPPASTRRNATAR